MKNKEKLIKMISNVKIENQSLKNENKKLIIEDKIYKRINQVIKEENYRLKCWKIINEIEDKFPKEKIISMIKEYKKNDQELENYYKVMEPITKKISKLSEKQTEIENFVQTKMERYNKKEIIVSGYIAKLMKVIHETQGRIKYKAAFEEALKKVNLETKKLLKEFAIKTKEVQVIEDKIFTLEKLSKKVSEGFMDTIKTKLQSIINWIKSFGKKIAQNLDGINSAQDDFIKEARGIFENYQLPFNTLKK